MKRAVSRLLERATATLTRKGSSIEAELDALSMEIRQFPKRDLIEAVKNVIRDDPTRSAAAVFVLGELIHDPEALKELERLYHNVGSQERHWIVQSIAISKCQAMAPFINHVLAEEQDALVMNSAVYAAGVLQHPANMSRILELASQGRTFPALLGALVSYSKSECTPFLRATFDKPVPDRPPLIDFEHCYTESEATHRVERWITAKSDKVLAASGLARLGDQESIKYLISMLDDPDVRCSNSYFPGESLNAAKSLSTIYGILFIPIKDTVAEVKSMIVAIQKNKKSQSVK